MFRLSIFVAIPSRQVFAIAILNVIWLSTTLVESSFLECLLAASKTKKPAPRQQDDKTKKWLNPNPNTTQNSSSKLYFDLLVVIPAHAKNDIERRVAQRESWQMLLQSNGSCLSCGSARSVRVIYVVGSETNEALAEEIEKYGDIVVLEGFSQNYYKDRARKTRLSIRTAVENFDFGLLMKTDTDSFIFLDRLLPLLEQKNMFWERPELDAANRSDGDSPNDLDGSGSLSIYAGDFSGSATAPITTAGHKWEDKIYKNVTLLSAYPRHAKGPGYFLSPDLARYIATLEEPLHISGRMYKAPSPQDLPSEDVSVGFWLFSKKYVQISLPVCLKDHGCNKARDCILDHYVGLTEMRKRWQRFNQTKGWCGA